MEVRCDVRCGTVQRLRVAGHSLSTLPTTTKRRGRRRRLMHGRAGWYWQLLPQLWRRASVEALLFCCHLTGTAQPRTSVSAAAFLCRKNEILEGTLHGFTQKKKARMCACMYARTHTTTPTTPTTRRGHGPTFSKASASAFCAFSLALRSAKSSFFNRSSSDVSTIARVCCDCASKTKKGGTHKERRGWACAGCVSVSVEGWVAEDIPWHRLG